MKRVLFIIPFLSSGGAERVVSIWASELAKLGLDVHLLLFYRVENEYKVNKNVKVHVIKENKEDYDRLSKLKKNAFLRLNFKKIRPEFVIPFISHVGIMANFARFGLKVKLIETVRIDPKYSPRNKILRIMRNISILLSDRCIVQNEVQKQYFPKYLQEKIQVLPNPMSTEFIETKRIMESTSIKSLLAVGRLEYQKNYEMLIKAFSQIKNLNLTLKIYGEGSLKIELQNLIEELALTESIELCGRTDNMKKVYENADLFILSSNAEGMPNSLMEAMSVGLPCISTDCPTGPSDLIDNEENGILIPVGDEEKLINSITNLIDNPQKAFKMGEKAKEKMKKNYSSETSAKNLLTFLNSI